MNAAIAHRRARLSGLLAAQAAAAASSARTNLEITELQLFAVREPVSARSYTIVRISARSGLSGFGECAHARAGDLQAAKSRWVGRPATSYVDSDASPLSGAINMALLDLVGKACKAPVYRVLGGPTRNKARALASLAGSSNSELLAILSSGLNAGFRAFSIPAPEPAARNQGKAYQIAIASRFRELREKAGNGVDFVIDARRDLTPGDAASVATTIEPFHPLWFDEPCAISNMKAIQKISDESVVPLGFGRTVESAGTFQDLLRAGCIDVVRPDISREGITGARRIAALAEVYYVAVAPNHDGGPIATAAALQLAASLPNFFVQHIPFPAAAEDRRMRAEIAGAAIETVRNGFAALPSGPGLGVNVTESALEKYRAA
jgi:galactonate dehydratase